MGPRRRENGDEVPARDTRRDPRGSAVYAWVLTVIWGVVSVRTLSWIYADWSPLGVPPAAAQVAVAHGRIGPAALVLVGIPLLAAVAAPIWGFKNAAIVLAGEAVVGALTVGYLLAP